MPTWLSDGRGDRKRGGAAPAALTPDKASSITTEARREPGVTVLPRPGAGLDGCAEPSGGGAVLVLTGQQIDDLRDMFQCDDVHQ